MIDINKILYIIATNINYLIKYKYINLFRGHNVYIDKYIYFKIIYNIDFPRGGFGYYFITTFIFPREI
jgi:hypothetical protein